MKKMRMVEVEWLDSYGSFGWQDRENCESDTHATTPKTIGYLLQSKRDELLLVQSWSANELVAGAIAIPKCSVKKIRYLEVKV